LVRGVTHCVFVFGALKKKKIIKIVDSDKGRFYFVDFLILFRRSARLSSLTWECWGLLKNEENFEGFFWLFFFVFFVVFFNSRLTSLTTHPCFCFFRPFFWVRNGTARGFFVFLKFFKHNLIIDNI